MSSLVCLNELKGVGVPCSEVMPVTSAIAIGLLRPGATLADSESADALADWLALVASKDLFPIQNIFNVEDQKVEDGIHTSNFGEKTFLWEGVRGKRYWVKCNKDQHEILRTYSDLQWDIVVYDRNNNILVKINSDDTIGGIETGYLHVMNQVIGNNEVPTYTPIEFQEADAGEWDAQGGYLSPTFRVKNIKPITHVAITAGTITANEFTLTAYYAPARKFNADGTAITRELTGLTIDDIEVIDQTGAVNSLVSVTESTVTPGTYQVVGDTLTSGTVRIKPSATNLYESDTATLS